MNDPCDASHALLFSSQHASHTEMMVASIAIGKAAQAMDWAQRGDEARRRRRWGRLLPAELLAAPDLEAALAAAGIDADKRPTIAAAVRNQPLRSPDPAQWVAVTDVFGVGPDQHDLLRDFGGLAIHAARALAPPRALGCVRTTMLLGPVPPGDDDTAPSALLLAAQLDVPGLFDLEVFERLLLTQDRVLAHAPRVRPWLAPCADSTVQVRAPDDHPAVPFAFIALVVPDAATHRALAAGGVLDQLMDSTEPPVEPRAH